MRAAWAWPFVSLLAAPAWGQGGSLTDGAVTLTYTSSHWDGSPEAHLLGTEPGPATDPLGESGWFYRLAGDPREYPFPPPDSETYADGELLAHWADVDGRGFAAWEGTEATDQEGPSGGFTSHLTVLNNTGAPTAIELFHYLDADVLGSAGGDSAVGLSPAFIKFVEAGEAVRYRAWNPSHFMVRPFPEIRTLLGDGDADDLDDAGLPFGPGAVTAAFQFGLTLPPGSARSADVSVLVRLPRDRIKGARFAGEPYPSLYFRDSFRFSLRMRRTEMAGGNVSLLTSGPDFEIVGVDDFDGDFDQELVERDALTGETRVAGAVIAGAPAPPLNWKLSATGDFDADSRADLLWRNTTSQRLVVWLMNGNAKLGGLTPSPDHAVNANWDVAAAADFDGDGNRDLLWYNQTSGNLVLWYLDASVARITGSFTTPATLTNTNWRVVAVGDFGRGPGGVYDTQDIVWQNDTSRRIVVWHMDLAGVRSAGTFTTPDRAGPDAVVLGPR